MNILQKIFTDHYEEIKYTLHPRSTEMENIDKMINCGDSSFGGAMYGCPHCGKLKFVPFRCHSRFCPTCGNKYAIERTTSMSFKLVNVTHRHCVFTIDENLRESFLKDRSLLDCLFHSVNSVTAGAYRVRNSLLSSYLYCPAPQDAATHGFPFQRANQVFCTVDEDFALPSCPDRWTVFPPLRPSCDGYGSAVHRYFSHRRGCIRRWSAPVIHRSGG